MSGVNGDLPPGTPLNLASLDFKTAERIINYNFTNQILSEDSKVFLRDYFIADNPYTYLCK
ncbi:MAG: hypothetical protein IPJ45_17870 [Ignavibacteria bacterium]|nr:hypothetical protein [Ignavibacteria bacterium]